MIKMIARFVAGGLIVGLASSMSQIAPFLSGVLSGFPAVFLTTLLFIYLSSGKNGVRAYASTALWGIFASVVAFFGTALAAHWQWPWPFVILFGLVAYGVFVTTAIKISQSAAHKNTVLS